VDLPEDKGTYILIVSVKEMKRLEIGRLGMFDIIPGFYAYVGSAFGPGGIRARVGHHLESVAAPHWHIDYLLRFATPVEVWFAMMERPREPLVLEHVHQPEPGLGQVLVRVAACAVCRTDLHVLDGELPEPKLPLILGHEIVGRVVSVGAEVTVLEAGQRVGIPWLAWTCGDCGFCRGGQENLCERAQFTGYT